MAPRKSSSSTLFSSLPYEIYHHILSFAVDRELSDPSSRNQQIRTIANFQSINRRICTEMKEMQIYFNEFWWKVYERNFGLNPEAEKELEVLKEKMIKNGEIKRKIILANFIKFKLMKHSKFYPNSTKEAELKIVVMGGEGVGKSTLTIYFVQNVFIEEYDPTLEDSYRKNFIVDNIPGMLDILDTAAPEEYASMRGSFIRIGDAYIMVCSVTDSSSIDYLRQFSLKEVIRSKDTKVNDTPIVFVINKTDLLRDSNDKKETLKKYREEINRIIKDTSLANCSIIETSAKSGENVQLLFEEVVRRFRFGNFDNLKLLKQVLDLDSSCIETFSKTMKEPKGLTDRKRCCLM